MVDTEKLATTVRECALCGFVTEERVVVCPEDGSALITRKPDPLIGALLAERFEIQSLIGTGGMGKVYKARQTSVDRFVAVKVLHSERLQSNSHVLRFQQEAKAAASLSHPNIVGFFDYGLTEDNVPYIVMDYVEGTSLEEVLKSEAILSVDRAVRIFMQACDALDHAHQKGIIHRDIKPSNLMLVGTADGATEALKILDFGIAKLLPKTDDEKQILTVTGEVFGSPQYMSPEQCAGKAMDVRSDVYSLGCVMYEALIGRPPFRGESLIDTIYKHAHEAPQRFKQVRPELDIPEQLEALVLKALEKEPDMRFPSMAVLKRNLEFVPQFAEDEKKFAQEPQKKPNSIGRKLHVVGLLCISLTLVLAGAAVWYLSSSGTDKQQLSIAWTEITQGSHSKKLLEPVRRLRDQLQQAGKLRDALGYAQRAAILAKEQEPNTSGEAGDLLAIGRILYAMKDDTAREYMNEARDRLRRVAQVNRDNKKHAANAKFGGTDDTIIEIDTLLGEAEDAHGLTDALGYADDLRLSGDRQKSDVIYKKILANKEKLTKEQLALLATSLQSLASEQNVHGQSESAEANYKLAIELSTEVYGERSESTAQAQRQLGLFMQKLSRYTAAEDALLNALAIANTAVGERSPLSVGILLDLSKLYVDMKEQKKASDMQKLAESLKQPAQP